MSSKSKSVNGEGERASGEALTRALAMATTDSPVRLEKLKVTTKRLHTRRGVMWLGQTCNLRCHFCYFIERIKSKDHPEHAFMSLDKAKTICSTLVDEYGNNAIDIQGGEPTIWKDCLELVRHCVEIGLTPTLITNALELDKVENCQAYLDAGVRDMLVSVHGLGEVHDRVVGHPKAHRRQMAALKNMQEIGMRFRFNCVLSKPVVEQLPDIARLAIATGAGAVNFLAFNPFEDQAKGELRSAENVPRYADVVAYLGEALDLLEAAGIEANVRYYPLCTVEERHRKSMYNFQQFSFDHHEWDFASWTWTGMQPQRMRGGDVSATRALSGQGSLHVLQGPASLLMKVPVLKSILPAAHRVIMGSIESKRDPIELYRENARVRAELHLVYVYAERCSGCSVKAICDGFHGDYAAIFGTDEAEPIVLDKDVDDPRFFISAQEKLVEREDEEWSL